MRISDWSSDLCSSDLRRPAGIHGRQQPRPGPGPAGTDRPAARRLLRLRRGDAPLQADLRVPGFPATQGCGIQLLTRVPRYRRGLFRGPWNNPEISLTHKKYQCLEKPCTVRQSTLTKTEERLR